MNRETIIEKIVDRMPDWLKRDPGGFWQHIGELETAYLEKHSDKELDEILLES